MDLFRWLALFDQIQKAGERAQGVFDVITKAAVDNGIQADNDALDAVITNATRREALARREASGAS